MYLLTAFPHSVGSYWELDYVPSNLLKCDLWSDSQAEVCRLSMKQLEEEHLRRM